MSRFYKTSDPVFVDDKMLRLPYEAMAGVVEKMEQGIQQNLNITKKFGELDVNALSQQKEDKDRILSSYEERASEIAKKIQTDPKNYKNFSSEIENLQREVHKDTTRGDLHTIQSNFDSFQNYLKEEQERVNKGDILQADLDPLIKKRFSEFQGRNEYGDLNVFDIEKLNNYFNTREVAEELGKGYIADKTYQAGVGANGNYIYKDKSTNEFVKPETIEEDVFQSLMNDEQFNAYYQQQDDIWGSRNKEETARQEAKRVASKYGYLKQTGEKSMQVDSSKAFSFAKKEEHSDLSLSFVKPGTVNSSSSETKEGLENNLKTYIEQENTAKNILGNITLSVFGVENIDSLNSEEKELHNNFISAIENGSISDEQILEMGIENIGQIKDLQNTIVTNKILQNQNRATWDNYQTEGAVKNQPYEEWATSKGIKNQNKTNVSYSLDNFEMSKEEKEATRKHVAKHAMTGIIDLSNHPAIVKEILEKADINNINIDSHQTEFSIQQLVEIGQLTPSTKFGKEILKETVEVDKRSGLARTFSWFTDPELEEVETGEVSTISAIRNITGLQDFKFVPETLGIANTYDSNGRINYAMRADAAKGEHFIVKYPFNLAPNSKASQKIGENYKVLKLKDVLAKGTKAGTYTLGGGFKVLEIDGTQYIRNTETGTSYGTVDNMTTNALKIISNHIYR